MLTLLTVFIEAGPHSSGLSDSHTDDGKKSAKISKKGKRKESDNFEEIDMEISANFIGKKTPSL